MVTVSIDKISMDCSRFHKTCDVMLLLLQVKVDASDIVAD